MTQQKVRESLSQNDGDLVVRLKDMFDAAWNPHDVPNAGVPNSFIGPCVVVYRLAEDGDVTGRPVSRSASGYEALASKSMIAPRVWVGGPKQQPIRRQKIGILLFVAAGLCILAELLAVTK